MSDPNDGIDAANDLVNANGLTAEQQEEYDTVSSIRNTVRTK